MRPLTHHRFRTEAEYFYKLNQELIENLRSRAAHREERQLLAEVSQVFDPAILDSLESLGFTHDTVTLLFLVPLVQVAWADGSVSQIERDHILAIYSIRGRQLNAHAFEQLTSWFDHRPSEAFFEQTLGVIRAVLGTLSLSEMEACKQAILVCCRDEAITPWPVIGWVSRICHAKQKVIDNISKQLETRMAAAV